MLSKRLLRKTQQIQCSSSTNKLSASRKTSLPR